MTPRARGLLLDVREDRNAAGHPRPARGPWSTPFGRTAGGST